MEPLQAPGPASTGPPLTLRPLSVEHLPWVMTWVNDRDVMQYFANRQTDISEAAEHAYLEAFIASKNDRGWSVFTGDEYVGQCSVNQIYWPARNGRLFMAVRKSMQGFGHASSVLHALVDRAFTELDLHKVWLIVRRDNRRAQASYVKAGFDFEGLLRDEYFVEGRFHDMVRMSLLNPRHR